MYDRRLCISSQGMTGYVGGRRGQRTVPSLLHIGLDRRLCGLQAAARTFVPG